MQFWGQGMRGMGRGTAGQAEAGGKESSCRRKCRGGVSRQTQRALVIPQVAAAW